MRKRFILILLIFVGSVLLITVNKHSQNDFVPAPDVRGAELIPKIEPEKAEIGSKENPDARRAYEQAMLVDPQSGEIPKNIRQKETLSTNRDREFLLDKYRVGGRDSRHHLPEQVLVDV